VLHCTPDGAQKKISGGGGLFEIDSEPLQEQGTALGGIPLLVRAARSLDVPGSVQRHLRVKQRERRFDEATYVESFVVLNAVGRTAWRIVSNMWDWTVKRLLEWPREKAGAIEAVHEVIKNERAGGGMPCGRFGANAAGLRLAGLTPQVLRALKRLARSPELLLARAKRLRFLIFNTPGKLVHHARRTRLRLGWSWQRFSNWHGALRLLPLPAC
jgi:hypothetical protein